MKFLLPAFAFFATALGQGLTIPTPQEGDNVPVEEPFTIQIIKNNHIMSSIEVGLAIGIISCADGSDCPGLDQMGTVLYNGPFDPQIHEGTNGAYQNFTVTVPSQGDLVGRSKIGVARTFMIGAGNGVVLQTYGVEVEVGSS